MDSCWNKRRMHTCLGNHRDCKREEAKLKNEKRDKREGGPDRQTYNFG